MNIKDTSLDTYSKLTNYFGKCQIDIYRYIVDNPGATRREIAKGLEFEINNVCGRVNELVKSGLVIESGKVQCRVSKRQVESLISVKEVDWELLDIKRRENKALTPIPKEFLPVIYKMHQIIEKALGGEEKFKQLGHKQTVNEMIKLRDYILEKNKDLSMFCSESTKFKLKFKIESESRKIFHEVIYDRINKTISCSCEDHKFRKNKCKHMKKITDNYKLEIK